MNKRGGLALFLAILLMPACRSMIGGPRLSGSVKSEQAASLLSGLEKGGAAACSFKGIGKVRLWGPDGVQVSRMAWLGSTDGRLRMEAIGPAGQPFAKLIYDGEKYYFLSPADQKLYRKSCADPSLKPLTGVEIRISEIVLYLAGSIPVLEYDTVLLQKGRAASGDVLVLKKRFAGVVERIYLNQSATGVQRVEVFNRGRLVYRAVLTKIRDVNGHQIPFELVVSKGEKRGFSLSADRCWTDITVSSDTFSLGQ